MMKSGALRTTCVWSIALCVGVVSTLAWSGLGRADSHGHGGHGHGHSHAGGFVWHVLKAKEALGLSDEQETKLRAIGVNATKDRVKKEAEIELAEIDLHQLFHEQDKQESAGDIEGAIRKLYALKADLRIASFKALQSARAVLTPEQRKKQRELHEKDRCSMEEKRSEFHGTYGQHGDEPMSGGRAADNQ